MAVLIECDYCSEIIDFGQPIRHVIEATGKRRDGTTFHYHPICADRAVALLDAQREWAAACAEGTPRDKFAAEHDRELPRWELRQPLHHWRERRMPTHAPWPALEGRPIEDLGLNARARRSLHRAGITSCEELVKTPVTDLLNIREIGAKEARAILLAVEYLAGEHGVATEAS